MSVDGTSQLAFDSTFQNFDKEDFRIAFSNPPQVRTVVPYAGTNVKRAFRSVQYSPTGSSPKQNGWTLALTGSMGADADATPITLNQFFYTQPGEQTEEQKRNGDEAESTVMGMHMTYTTNSEATMVFNYDLDFDDEPIVVHNQLVMSGESWWNVEGAIRTTATTFRSTVGREYEQYTEHFEGKYGKLNENLVATTKFKMSGDGDTNIIIEAVGKLDGATALDGALDVTAAEEKVTASGKLDTRNEDNQYVQWVDWTMTQTMKTTCTNARRALEDAAVSSKEYCVLDVRQDHSGCAGWGKCPTLAWQTRINNTPSKTKTDVVVFSKLDYDGKTPLHLDYKINSVNALKKDDSGHAHQRSRELAVATAEEWELSTLEWNLYTSSSLFDVTKLLSITGSAKTKLADDATYAFPVKTAAAARVYQRSLQQGAQITRKTEVLVESSGTILDKQMSMRVAQSNGDGEAATVVDKAFSQHVDVQWDNKPYLLQDVAMYMPEQETDSSYAMAVSQSFDMDGKFAPNMVVNSWGNRKVDMSDYTTNGVQTFPKGDRSGMLINVESTMNTDRMMKMDDMADSLLGWIIRPIFGLDKFQPMRDALTKAEVPFVDGKLLNMGLTETVYFPSDCDGDNCDSRVKPSAGASIDMPMAAGDDATWTGLAPYIKLNIDILDKDAAGFTVIREKYDFKAKNQFDLTIKTREYDGDMPQVPEFPKQTWPKGSMSSVVGTVNYDVGAKQGLVDLGLSDIFSIDTTGNIDLKITSFKGDTGDLVEQDDGMVVSYKVNGVEQYGTGTWMFKTPEQSESVPIKEQKTRTWLIRDDASKYDLEFVSFESDGKIAKAQVQDVNNKAFKSWSKFRLFGTVGEDGYDYELMSGNSKDAKTKDQGITAMEILYKLNNYGQLDMKTSGYSCDDTFKKAGTCEDKTSVKMTSNMTDIFDYTTLDLTLTSMDNQTDIKTAWDDAIAASVVAKTGASAAPRRGSKLSLKGTYNAKPLDAEAQLYTELANPSSAELKSIGMWTNIWYDRKSWATVYTDATFPAENDENVKEKLVNAFQYTKDGKNEYDLLTRFRDPVDQYVDTATGEVKESRTDLKNGGAQSSKASGFMFTIDGDVGSEGGKANVDASNYTHSDDENKIGLFTNVVWDTTTSAFSARVDSGAKNATSKWTVNDELWMDMLSTAQTNEDDNFQGTIAFEFFGNAWLRSTGKLYKNCTSTFIMGNFGFKGTTESGGNENAGGMQMMLDGDDTIAVQMGTPRPPEGDGEVLEYTLNLNPFYARSEAMVQSMLTSTFGELVYLPRKQCSYPKVYRALTNECNCNAVMVKNAAGVCTCPNGYEGINCDRPVCKLGANKKVCSGSAQGECAMSARVCRCKSKFTGPACETEKKACPKIPNQNQECGGAARGVCNPVDGKCLCRGKYFGNACESEPPTCDAATDCSGRGFCIYPNPTTAACECTTQRYTGEKCDQDTFQKCSDTYCQNGGRCVGPTDSANRRCECPANFLGETCSTPRPCPKGASGVECSGANGRCENSRCVCTAGFTGSACELDLCQYLKVDCKNGGTCSKGECTCRAGFKGLRCQFEQAKCPQGVGGQDCSARGSCVTNTDVNSPSYGAKFCQCGVGSTGRACETLTCAVNSNNEVCNGNGRCEQGVCRCAPGFAGAECDEDKRLCGKGVASASDTCYGNGVCDADTFRCRCKSGDADNNCKTLEKCKVAANGVECGGNGECLRAAPPFASTCKCDAGYTGETCEPPADRVCDGKADLKAKGIVCSGQGQCKADGKCECVPPYSGDGCETRAACPKSKDAQGVEQECGGAERGECVSKTVTISNFKTVSQACKCKNLWSGPACGIQEKLCPRNPANGLMCSEPDATNPTVGRCDTTTGQCKCLTADREGTYCAERAQNYLLCDGTNASAPVATSQSLCGGVGVCKYRSKYVFESNRWKKQFEGYCSCPTQFFGSQCQERWADCELGSNGVACSGNGVCNKFNGQCNCNADYDGIRCDIPTQKACLTNTATKLECSGPQQGTCDVQTGMCVCKVNSLTKFKEFTGAACQNEVPCSHISQMGTRSINGKETTVVCSGNGVCNANKVNDYGGRGVCQCARGYTGASCGQKKEASECSKQVCTNGGICNPYTGKCMCPYGYAGDQCQDSCPQARNGAVCGGRGTCNFADGTLIARDVGGKIVGGSGTCSCRFGFTGKDCSKAPCPTTIKGKPCSGTGECTHNFFTGLPKCKCHEGFFGYRCNVKRNELTAKVEELRTLVQAKLATQDRLAKETEQCVDETAPFYCPVEETCVASRKECGKTDEKKACRQLGKRWCGISCVDKSLRCPRVRACGANKVRCLDGSCKGRLDKCGDDAAVSLCSGSEDGPMPCGDGVTCAKNAAACKKSVQIDGCPVGLYSCESNPKDCVADKKDCRCGASKKFCGWERNDLGRLIKQMGVAADGTAKLQKKPLCMDSCSTTALTASVKPVPLLADPVVGASVQLDPVPTEDGAKADPIGNVKIPGNVVASADASEKGASIQFAIEPVATVDALTGSFKQAAGTALDLMSAAISITPDRLVEIDAGNTGQGIEIDLCIGDPKAQTDGDYCKSVLRRLRPYSSQDITADDAQEVAGGCTKGAACGCSCKFVTPHLTSFVVADANIPYECDQTDDMVANGDQGAASANAKCGNSYTVKFDMNINGFDSVSFDADAQNVFKTTLSQEEMLNVAEDKITLGQVTETATARRLAGGITVAVTVNAPTQGVADRVTERVADATFAPGFASAYTTNMKSIAGKDVSVAVAEVARPSPECVDCANANLGPGVGGGAGGGSTTTAAAGGSDGPPIVIIAAAAGGFVALALAAFVMQKRRSNAATPARSVKNVAHGASAKTDPFPEFEKNARNSTPADSTGMI
eukprot:g2493.t1